MNTEQLHALRTVLDYLAEAEKEDFESLLELIRDRTQDEIGGRKISEILDNHIWPSIVTLYNFLRSQEQEAALKHLKPGTVVTPYPEGEEYETFITENARAKLGDGAQQFFDESMQVVESHIMSIAKQLRRSEILEREMPTVHWTWDKSGTTLLLDTATNTVLIALKDELNDKLVE